MPVVIRIVALIVLLFSWAATLRLGEAGARSTDKETKGLYGEGTLLGLLVSILCMVILIKG